MLDSVWPQRQQPARLPHPGDSPGKNTGVGCHFLLQCMKVKSESEGGQLCLPLHDPMDCSLPSSSVHRIFQARVLQWVAIAFSASKEQLSFHFMAAVTTCSYFRAPKMKFAIVSTVSPSICHEVMGPDAMILVFEWLSRHLYHWATWEALYMYIWIFFLNAEFFPGYIIMYAKIH